MADPRRQRIQVLRRLSKISSSGVWKNSESAIQGEGDVDITAPRSEWHAIEREFKNFAFEAGSGWVVVCRHSPGAMFLVTSDPSTAAFEVFDVRDRVTFSSVSLFRSQDVENLMKIGGDGFRRMRPGAEGLMKLVLKGSSPTGKPKWELLQKEQVVPLLAQDPEGVTEGARALGAAGRPIASAARELVETGRWNRRLMLVGIAKLLARGITEPRVVFARLWYRMVWKRRCPVVQIGLQRQEHVPGDPDIWLRNVSDSHRVTTSHRVAGSPDVWSDRRGKVITIAGPDGVGKTTLADALTESMQSAAPVRRMRHPTLLPHRTKHEGPVTQPHNQTPDPVWLSYAKTIYWYVDFILGWSARVTPHVRKGGWVINERGWWDYVVDPTRYRLKASAKPLLRLLGRMVPEPDTTLVLEAPPELVMARKNELTLEEIGRQTREWRDMATGGKKIYLDASAPVERLVRQAMEAIGPSASGELTSPGGWIRHPRWILPRGPRKVAAAGLRVYHPVTWRGLAGWEIARVAASAGAFRLLPAGTGPPSWVIDTVAAHTSNDGTVAVARTNHPGRYVALVLDADGHARAVAKIARDQPGCEGLTREYEAMHRLAPLLSEPLSAPRLLAHAEGLLLFENTTWIPRIRPWFLPSEVAGAIGRFYRAGTDNGSAGKGLSHGDFAPWNLLRTETGWVAIDWEEAGGGRPPFFDIFHHLVQSHALLRRPTTKTLIAGLSGEGWVGAAIEAYARGASLSPSDTKDLFVAYLEESATTQKVTEADGRRGFEARKRLLRILSS